MTNNKASNHPFPWSLLVGFFLSIILTLVAVGIGSRTDFTYGRIVIFVFILAFIQAAIQLFMFMHVSEGEHGIWQIGKMLSAAFIAVVIVAGSVWVLNAMH